MANQFRVFPDGATTAVACGQLITAALLQELSERQEATLALSGGSSPKPLFSFLADQPIPWDRVHVFWVDERCVPPTHQDSNYRMANELLLTPAKVPARCVHRIAGEMEPEAAAAQYADQIRQYFGLSNGQIPEFTVVHQGMGPDGHTASLFPGQPLIEDRTGVAAAVYVEKMKSHRVTLLPAPLLAAKQTVFLAGGADKTEVLREVLHGQYQPLQYPSQLLVHHGREVTWFVDQAAAGDLLH